ncbi:hypothetical protein JCM8547_002896 [Rhodosporidiobolus lusitaniae]
MASHPSYSTFPRASPSSSSRPSPSSTAPSTPRRQSFPALSSAVPIAGVRQRTSTTDQPVGSWYDRLSTSWATLRPGGGSGTEGKPLVGQGEAEWEERGEDSRFRSFAERAEQQARPEDWSVLLAAGRQSATIETVGGGGVKRRSSRSSLLPRVRERSQSRERGKEAPRRRTKSTVTESTLAEEPESYAYAPEAELYGTVEERERDREERGFSASSSVDEENGADASSVQSSTPLLPNQPSATPSRPSLPSRLLSTLTSPSPLAKNVAKCVLAYYLGSLFTFLPILSDLVGAPWDAEGPVRNAHVIATVAVYFMPARTLGGMVEADAYLLVAAVFATFLVCGSMGLAVLFERLNLLQLGHALILLFFLGGGYGLMAYTKVVMNKPSISTACSLVSLICSGIITKEGALHVGAFRTRAVEQVLLIAAIGAGISNAICFLLWPMSATDKLQADLNKTFSSYGTLVDTLTKTFLLETDFSVPSSLLQSSINTHQSTFTTLKTSLSQAKWEIFDSRIAGRPLTQAYDAAVASMTRLAQGLTGMRAGVEMQGEILRAREEGRLPMPGKEGEWEEAGELGEKERKERDRLWDEMVVLERFREHVGASMTALAQTSTTTLSLLGTSFVRNRPTSITAPVAADDPESARPLPAEELLRVRQELESALGLFKREHSRAVKILYRSLPSQTLYGAEAFHLPTSPPLPSSFSGPQPPPSPTSSSAPNDNLFRIYTFSFTLEEWAQELLHLTSIFIVLRETEEEVQRRSEERKRRWGVFSGVVKVVGGVLGLTGRREGKVGQLGRQFARAMKTPKKKHRSPFPEIVDGALSSHQQSLPSSSSYLTRLKLAFWHLGYHLRQPHVRFAIKTGAGVAFLSSAAFIPKLRPIWLEWRGEWSLISYFVVSAPSMGDSNFLALGRVLGTALGAAVAVACYSAFPENQYVLPLLGALFSAPCFWVAITRPQYAPSSRFVLLTFNLTCLYSFNLREVDLEVGSIAYHRFVAVVVGVLWGLLFSTYIWPFEARRELRRGLSEFFLNASFLYERLVRVYSVPPPSLSRTSTISRRSKRPSNGFVNAEVDERTSLLPKEARIELDAQREDFVAMELELQLLLIRVSGLLAASRHEPRLKGAFPVAEYRRVLTACQSLLDSLTAIARMTNREQFLMTVRRDFVTPVNKERREMVGNVILYFSILSSAVSLKTPLPAYLPPAADARERLVARLHELEVVKRRRVRGGSESLLYLAYTTIVRDVIAQLEEVGGTFQRLFGIIGGSAVNDFEELFREEPVERTNLSSDDESESSDEDSGRGV